MSYIDSMPVDDSDGDDIIANHNEVDCDVITVQLKLKKSLSTHMYLDKPGERREGSRAVDEGDGCRGRGGQERESQGGLDLDGGGDQDYYHEIVKR